MDFVDSVFLKASGIIFCYAPVDENGYHIVYIILL